jgi:hypothetical protein
MKTTVCILFGLSAVLIGTQIAQARGFGGGFHGGGFSAGGFSGGGFRGGDFSGGGFSGGGFRGGGFDAGGSRAGGFDASGFHAGGVEAGGFHAGGVEAGGFHAGGVEAGSFHAGGVEAGGFHAGGFESAGIGHVGLPTDGAFGRAGVAGYGAIGNHTAAWSGSVYAARGAAVRNSFVGYGAFRPGWYGAHPGAWAAAGWATGAAWNAAAWPAIGTWCGWGANVQPFDYDYGNNITYQGDEVYYGTQPAATAQQYYQQAATLAQSAPPTPAALAAADWMPLGVFSLVQGDQTDSATMFQLALSKSGDIAGNYYGALTETTLPVHGAVDKRTQRAAWTVGDNKTTVYEAGITSLTKDEAPVLIHFNKDQTQQWMLVRLKQPEQAAQQ